MNVWLVITGERGEGGVVQYVCSTRARAVKKATPLKERARALGCDYVEVARYSVDADRPGPSSPS